ncbi:MAG: SGNH/GDSL hydrolase family protein [Armatimonadetes bacterium]|nr:SGNH/GDSL hydrolase family protein [Armatimonadota bacterium]
MVLAMTTGLCAALMLCGACGDAVAQGDGPRWRPAHELTIEGMGWTAVAEPFSRLPAAAHGRVPESVWGLGRHSAGIAVRFVTDSPTVTVRWTLLEAELAMPHMPATGVSGVDLYARAGKGPWTFVQNGRPAGGLSHEVRAGLEVVAPGHTGAVECLLYLPLYNGSRLVEVGVPWGKSLEAAPERPAGRGRPVVFYGTSIVQGGCASRPGMAHTAILGRRLDRGVINLGFSGSGRMEAAVADLLAELDPAAYVIDCLWNMAGMSDVEMTEKVTYLAKALRKAHPNTPILFVGQSNIHSGGKESHASQVQAQAVAALKQAGVTGLHVAPGADLLHGDEGTVDGVHPTDLGFVQHADALEPLLRKLLATAR